MTAPGMRGLAVVVVTLLCLSACTGTSRTPQDYQHKLSNTASAINSTVQIAALDAEMVRDDKVLATHLRVSLEQAYSDASSTATGFDAVLPPTSAAAAERQKVDRVFSQAVRLLRRMRVLAGLGQESKLPDLLPRLRRLSEQLKRIEGAA